MAFSSVSVVANSLRLPSIKAPPPAGRVAVAAAPTSTRT
jgi:hypothetical protein